MLRWQPVRRRRTGGSGLSAHRVVGAPASSRLPVHPCAGGSARHPRIAPRASAPDSRDGPPAAVPPDFARPASVAAAFFTAWASIDHPGQPGRDLDRCADLVTPALKRQLAVGQTAPAAWRAMRAEHWSAWSTSRQSPTPLGLRRRCPAWCYLRVYAQRVTTTSAGRTVTSDGITVQLAPSRAMARGPPALLLTGAFRAESRSRRSEPDRALPLLVVVVFAASPATPAQAGDAGLGGTPSSLARTGHPRRTTSPGT